MSCMVVTPIGLTSLSLPGARHSSSTSFQFKDWDGVSTGTSPLSDLTPCPFASSAKHYESWTQAAKTLLAVFRKIT
jgi:hypothetical protein